MAHNKKERADGQIKNYKGRLVPKGFQEKEAPQYDSPTMLREPMKLFFFVTGVDKNFSEARSCRSKMLKYFRFPDDVIFFEFFFKKICGMTSDINF